MRRPGRSPPAARAAPAHALGQHRQIVVLAEHFAELVGARGELVELLAARAAPRAARLPRALSCSRVSSISAA